jgi:hypothetical protein
MVNVKIPVQKINLSVAGITGDAVLFDNFKLYANGVGADFELYNAKTGIEYTDLESEKDSNTAYRLSWMNASDKTVFYNVVASYSDGTSSVVASIEMKPGSDNVNTGVIKPEGKAVTLSLEQVESQTPVDDPDDIGGGNQGGSGNVAGEEEDTTILFMVLLTITVFVACACAIAVALVLTDKRFRKNRSIESAEATETDAE